ncbi:vitamin K epoxide reductase complex subunit 1-like protein 1 [Lingula anatina]|uniref:vitamin-K-epoxide reductase (warfarin-sensitive) n=1 Tax=Lingula anatina TaxID=7574 RepID=A0A1S3H0F8_LINAN|nr:vitamin K epoxide reductase complex subunit 1-like protein 1 [Lingula anatina]|eukprot:XP_013378654.1 vitamin K epoxide reductase complex subunit 1-like protein 1 [Lingula anatina]
MSASRLYTSLLLLLCVLGFLVSVYAYHVEITKERDSSYRAMCDISAKISCSKVFTSRWGRGFGLIELVVGDHHHWLNQPNSVFGILYYMTQVVLGVFCPTVTAATMQLVISVTACLGCVYLAYILYFVLEDFCVVCVSSYIINAIILIVNILNLNLVKSNSRKSEGSRRKKEQ